jgi:hypothetical protein
MNVKKNPESAIIGPNLINEVPYGVVILSVEDLGRLLTAAVRAGEDHRHCALIARNEKIFGISDVPHSLPTFLITYPWRHKPPDLYAV